jgi:hypothetical protein
VGVHSLLFVEMVGQEICKLNLQNTREENM